MESVTFASAVTPAAALIQDERTNAASVNEKVSHTGKWQ